MFTRGIPGLALLVAVVFAGLAGCATVQTVGGLGDLIVGKYRATAQQVRYADAHAKRAVAVKKSSARYIAVRTTDPTASQKQEIQATIKASPAAAKKYGLDPEAVRKPEWTLKKPVFCVMVWDTEAKEIVGNHCYAVLVLPPPGAVVPFETYSAEYVAIGTGTGEG